MKPSHPRLSPALRDLELDPARTNLDGGGISIEHLWVQPGTDHRQSSGIAETKGPSPCARNAVHRWGLGIATILERV
ncbi:hypothetical protein [Cupriavidus sp. RAF12]|uniref:hypothetical protein n=1 Tax=Cupriavidus sp. RAF12 TaxID=3233050 RepID=UPI003F91296B